ncbi:right-handed parallel beta-helix repeat-containing protein, partial [Candidatus Woesearchaeota archaeon]|nr:right-handed parallel beta-helix repeat-containing protein [Candidatus Woesearchaeota archaeon]
ILQITAFDGTENSTKINSSALTINNSVAIITTPAIIPTPAFSNDTLTGYSIYTDIDNDTGIVYFRWFKDNALLFSQTQSDVIDGANVTFNLSNGNFTSGNAIRLEVTAFDSIENTTPENSSVITLNNTLPVLTSANLSLTIAYTNDTIVGSTVYTDLDNHNGIVYFEWFKNNTIRFAQTNTTVINGTNVSSMLSPTNFSRGDTIILQITTNDGNNGNITKQNSTALTINNSVGEQTTPLINAPIIAYVNDQINASVVYTDQDNDLASVYFEWFVNGIQLFTNSVSGIYNNTNVSLQLIPRNYSERDSIIVQTTIFDGVENSSKRNSSAMKIEGCTPPRDDLSIITNTILCDGTYHLNDTENGGLVFINGSNINLICNNTIIIDNDSSYGITQYGITINNAVNVTINGCYITKFYRGISINQGAANLTIINNTLNGSISGITIVDNPGNANITIRNNSIFNNEYGVLTSPATTYIFYNNFTNNSLYHIYATTANIFNITVAGKAHGNFYSNISAFRIYDTDADNFGDAGQQYPYNSSNGEKMYQAQDFGPITSRIDASPQIENITADGSVTTGSNINIRMQYIDNDSDTGTVYIEWFKNSNISLLNETFFTVANTSTLYPNISSENYTTGDIIVMQVFAADEVKNSTKQNTSNITVVAAQVPEGGSPPGAPPAAPETPPAAPPSSPPEQPVLPPPICVPGPTKCDDEETASCNDGYKEISCSNGCESSTKKISCCIENYKCEKIDNPKCENGKKVTEICKDLNICGKDKETSEICCVEDFTGCPDWDSVPCIDGKQKAVCEDKNACSPPKEYKQTCCIADYGNCPDFDKASCSDGKKEIICKDKNACMPDKVYTESCEEEPLEEEKKEPVYNIPKTDLAGAAFGITGFFTAGDNLTHVKKLLEEKFKLEIFSIEQDGNVIYKNGAFTDDVLFEKDKIAELNIKLINLGIEQLTNVRLKLNKIEDINTEITKEYFERIEPNAIVETKLRLQSNQDNYEKLILTLKTDQLSINYAIYVSPKSAVRFLNKQSLLRITKRIAPEVFKAVPTPVWWLFLFSLPLLLLLKKNYFVDERTLSNLTHTRLIHKYKRVYVETDIHKRYRTLKNLNYVEVHPKDHEEINDIHRKYKLPKDVCSLIITARRKYRPRIITTEEIPAEVRKKYWYITFVNPRDTHPGHELDAYIKKAHFNGYDDHEIKEQLFKQGWSSREIDKALHVEYESPEEILKSYVDRLFSIGHSVEDIKQELLKKGWNQKIVQEYIIKNKLDSEERLREYITAQKEKKIKNIDIFNKLLDKGWNADIVVKYVPDVVHHQINALQIVNKYIDSEIKNGKSIDSIRISMLQKGWKHKFVDDILTARFGYAAELLGEFIDNNLEQGLGIDEIREKLIHAGWKKEIVDKSIEIKYQHPTKQLMDYIDNCLLQGNNIRLLEKKLLKAGYHHTIVSYCIDIKTEKPLQILSIYVEKMLNEGMDIAVAEQKLLEKGWNKELVARIINVRLLPAVKQALQYINDDLNKNFSLDDIHDALLLKGWKKSFVNKIIEIKIKTIYDILDEFIEKELQQKEDIISIRQKLIEKGWKKEIVDNYLAQKIKEPMNKIIIYIESEINNGRDISELRQKLIDKGWKKEIIETLLARKYTKSVEELKEFFSLQLQYGKNIDQIREQLIEKGWKKEIVDAYIKKHYQESIDQLIDYIDNAIKDGFDILTIREQLVKKGWQNEMIDHYLNKTSDIKKAIESLHKYVEYALKNNIGIIDIRNNLLTKGWNKNIVNRFLETKNKDTLDILCGYIKKEMDIGTSKNKIIKKLTDAGWKKEVAEAAFN